MIPTRGTLSTTLLLLSAVSSAPACPGRLPGAEGGGERAAVRRSGDVRPAGAAFGDPSGELPRPAAVGHDLTPHDLDYLRRVRGQLLRMERAIHELGPDRDAALALAAAALAAAAPGRTGTERTGRPGEPGRADADGARGPAGEAASYVRQVLDACVPGWRKAPCERGLLAVQRLAIQYPGVLPENLAARLRREAAVPAPPPPPSALAHPWRFRETENQRMVLLAGSLASHTLAGSGDSPAARAWADYAVAFLAAHDREGWYEADSAGYLGISVSALLHLHDLAPDPRVRRLAGRELTLIFAAWAAEQVGGVPAGARTRTYLHWALGAGNLPWQAWAWYLAEVGDPEHLAFADYPEIAVSAYRLPEPVRELLAGRRERGSYEVVARRHIEPEGRSHVDAAIYSWATPDYVLSAAQAVEGLRLAVSGGQEIAATLLPEGGEFAPLYLWSRVDDARRERWRVRTGQEQAVAQRNLLLARMGTAEEAGYAYLAAGWSRPEPPATGEGAAGGEASPLLVSRYHDTYVALLSPGGWEVAPAPRRFPAIFARDPAYAGSWAAVPRRQPAAIGLEVGRAAEDGAFEVWRERVAKAALEVERDPAGEPLRLALRSSDGRGFSFRPGKSATLDDREIHPSAYPLERSPFLVHETGESAAWRFRLGDFEARLAPLAAAGAAAAAPPPEED